LRDFYQAHCRQPSHQLRERRKSLQTGKRCWCHYRKLHAGQIIILGPDKATRISTAGTMALHQFLSPSRAQHCTSILQIKTLFNHSVALATERSRKMSQRIQDPNSTLEMVASSDAIAAGLRIPSHRADIQSNLALHLGGACGTHSCSQSLGQEGAWHRAAMRVIWRNVPVTLLGTEWACSKGAMPDIPEEDSAQEAIVEAARRRSHNSPNAEDKTDGLDHKASISGN